MFFLSLESPEHTVSHSSHAITLLPACLHGNNITDGQGRVPYRHGGERMQLATFAVSLSRLIGLTLLSPSQQNFFRDAWNIFDFVSVVGAITDILVTELGVSAVERLDDTSP